VQAVSTDEVVVRLAARTAPLRQWEVARELRERLKTALDAAGGDEQVASAGGDDTAAAAGGDDQGGQADDPAVP